MYQLFKTSVRSTKLDERSVYFCKMILLAILLLCIGAVANAGRSDSLDINLEMWYISESDDFSGNNLPDRIIMKLPVHDQFVLLNLTKEKENVEVLQVKGVKIKSNDKTEHYSMYTDVSNEISLSMAVGSEGSVFYATFPFDGNVYNLLPASDLTSDYEVINKLKINRTEYVVAREVVNTYFKDDDVQVKKENGAPIMTKLDGVINSKLFPEGQKRNLTVEIYLVLDYSIFVKWYRLRNNDTQEAVRHIMYYFLNILNGVKQRYEHIDTPEFHLSAAVAGFYIALKEEAAPFPDSLKHIGRTSLSDFVLMNFALWTNEQTLPKHDVVALITDARQSDINGQGFVKAACTHAGISVTRDSGPFQTADTLTHEIGHNLGANHDGHGNDCPPSMHHIMTPSRKRSSDLVQGNEYLFSSCSLNYFKEYIKTLDENKTNCLADVPQSDNSLQNKRFKYPGQIYSLDEQCSLVYGQGAHVCGGARRERELCIGISCYEPDIGTCDPLFSMRPADGSPCGNKKWCVQGRCVYSENAKEFKDYCMYGNNKHSYFGKKCDELLNESKHWCYEETFRDECCQSCQEIKKDVEGCEYGDMSPLLCTLLDRPEDCNRSPYNEKCCETCNNPDKLKALQKNSYK